jgi:general secretion pathway protein B
VAAKSVRPTQPGFAPVIKVNGIAFQDGSSDSVAVVNGIPVSNGSIIEGAMVEDIQRDRIRFSYGSEKFEVPLGKTNR